jgi:excisionase family DNA binding protein
MQSDEDDRPRGRRKRRAYSIDEVSEETGAGRSKLYLEIRCKRLRAKKLGSRTLITSEALDEWLEQLPDYQAT